jgi:hypothetical protein
MLDAGRPSRQRPQETAVRRPDPETVARLYLTRAGWLLPDGAVLPAKALLEHLSALEGTEFGPLVSKARDEESAIEDEIYEIVSSEEAADPDSHPAMHRFFGWKEEPRERLVRDLYRAGLLRLGLRLDATAARGADWKAAQADPGNNVLEAEGLAEHVDAMERTLSSVARAMGTELRLIRYEIVSVNRRGKPVDEFLGRIDGDPPTSAPGMG